MPQGPVGQPADSAVGHREPQPTEPALLQPPAKPTPPPEIDAPEIDAPEIAGAYELHGLLSHLLRRAHFHAEALFTDRLGAHGITSRQLALLVAAAQMPGASQRAVGARIALDMNTVSDLLRRMEKRGLIERRPSDTDARSLAVEPSALGLQILREVEADNIAYQKALSGPLSEEESRQLKSLLQKLLDLPVS